MMKRSTGESIAGEDGEEVIADEEDEDVFGTPPAAPRNNRFSRRMSSATVGSAAVRPTSRTLYPSPFRGSPRRPSTARRYSNLRRGSLSLTRLSLEAPRVMSSRSGGRRLTSV